MVDGGLMEIRTDTPLPRAYFTERGLGALRRLASDRRYDALQYIMREAGRLAKLDVEAHPHMLRHAAGYMLANEGTDTRLIQAGKLGFHGGKVTIQRPRVRAHSGAEMALPSWQAAQVEDWLGRWAMNLMLINVSTHRGRGIPLRPGGEQIGVAGLSRALGMALRSSSLECP